MGISTLETALLDVVLDGFDACSVAAPSRVFRYVGVPPMDCCEEAGNLVAFAPDGYGTEGDIHQRGPRGTNQPFQSVLDLYLRWWTCWPAPTGLSGILPTPAEMDAAAVRVNASLDCAWFAIAAATCPGGALAACGQWMVMDWVPIRPQGECAGWEIRTKVRWTP